jgi:hypothetical protein
MMAVAANMLILPNISKPPRLIRVSRGGTKRVRGKTFLPSPPQQAERADAQQR